MFELWPVTMIKAPLEIVSIYELAKAILTNLSNKNALLGWEIVREQHWHMSKFI